MVEEHSAARPATRAAATEDAAARPVTGDQQVDQALHRLAELDARPTGEHAEVYEDVHRQLRDALTRLDPE
jgi:hypothetical protein